MPSLILEDLAKLNTKNTTATENVVLAIVSGFFLLFSTYCFTTIRYFIQRSYDRRYRGKEPNTLPYILPGVGSALSLIKNPHGFFESIR